MFWLFGHVKRYGHEKVWPQISYADQAFI